MLPELAAALPASLPFREVRDRMHQRSVWLGPKGTQTPLHCDPYHNLLCQVAPILRLMLICAMQTLAAAKHICVVESASM